MLIVVPMYLLLFPLEKVHRNACGTESFSFVPMSYLFSAELFLLFPVHLCLYDHRSIFKDPSRGQDAGDESPDTGTSTRASS